ncbi:phage tail protein [Asaia lannensis]|uniref:phage tail protein n=1 Tax=Asaia lannensis TaxID=415421 RepID=UPI001C995863
MPQLIQNGALNTAALPVPDLYIQIAQPETLLVSSVSSGLLGIVGTASWGPKDVPTVIGSLAQCREVFAGKRATPNNLNIAVDVALHQGASQFCLVRVTDGADTAAQGSLGNAHFTARYTGSAGNGLTLTLTRQNYREGMYVLTVSHEELGVTAYTGTDWSSLQDALNSDTRALVRVDLSGDSAITDTGSVRLGGGSDGADPRPERFIGSADVRTGLYALTSQGCAVATLAGLGDTTVMAAMLAFGRDEGVYMIAAGPKGESPAQAVQVKNALGLWSHALKYMHGDWLWWNDDALGLQLVSPALFAAGKLAALSPEQSGLNKPLSGIVGSQKNGLEATRFGYTLAELGLLIENGIDVICNPSPGGQYWSIRAGHNTAQNASVQSDAYTRLTNYLARALQGTMGQYVGSVINDTLFGNIRASLLGFLSGLLSQGILGVTGGRLPYAVVCDTTNNPTDRIATGYVQADVQVQYQGINEKFIINLQGGASVSVSTASGSV